MYLSAAVRLVIQKSYRWTAFDSNRGGMRLFGYATQVWIESCGMVCRLLYRTAGKPARAGTVVFVKGSLSFSYPTLTIGSTFIQHALDIRDLSPPVAYIYASGRITGEVRAFGVGDDSRVCFTVELHSPTPGALRCTCRRAARLIAELPRLYEQHFAAIVGKLGFQPGTILNVDVVQFTCLIYPAHVVEPDAQVIWPGPGGEDDRRVIGYYLPVNNDTAAPSSGTVAQEISIAAQASGAASQADTLFAQDLPVTLDPDTAAVPPGEMPDESGSQPGGDTSGYASNLPPAPYSLPFDPSSPGQAPIWSAAFAPVPPFDLTNAGLAGLSNAFPPSIPAWDGFRVPDPSTVLASPSSSLYGAVGPADGNAQQPPTTIDPRFALLTSTPSAPPPSDVDMNIDSQQGTDAGLAGTAPIVTASPPASRAQMWAPFATNVNPFPANATDGVTPTSYAANTGLSSLQEHDSTQLWSDEVDEKMDVGERDSVPPRTMSPGPTPSNDTGNPTASSAPEVDSVGQQVPDVLYAGPEDFPHPNAPQIHDPAIPLSPMAPFMAGTSEQYNWTSDEFGPGDYDMAPEDAFDVYLHDG